MKFCLGIEIGGTKLQLALGRGEAAHFDGLWRTEVDPRQGAAGVRSKILIGAQELLDRHAIRRDQIAGVGIGFGGPVDADGGVTIVSHQVEGWERFPLVKWVEENLGFPCRLRNDADSAALAESRFGAGRGYDPVMYLTVGSGIGGGLVCGGKIFRGSGAGALEIGHLRPGNLPRHIPHAGNTVESVASGFAIAERARRAIADWQDTLTFVERQTGGRPVRDDSSPHRTLTDPAFQQRFGPAGERFAKLLELAEGDPAKVTTNLIARAAREGDRLSLELLSDATHAIGWAIAQAITLINPARVVIGGGVSLIGDEYFFAPVRRACRSQVFGPFADLAEIVPAGLGEEVVVHGAVAVAAGAFLAVPGNCENHRC